MAWPALYDPDEDGIAFLVDGPSAYEVGPGKIGVIVFGVHAACSDGDRGIICMSTTDEVFDMEAHCAKCRMPFQFVLDAARQSDFVAWGIAVMSDAPRGRGKV